MIAVSSVSPHKIPRLSTGSHLRLVCPRGHENVLHGVGAAGGDVADVEDVGQRVLCVAGASAGVCNFVEAWLIAVHVLVSGAVLRAWQAESERAVRDLLWNVTGGCWASVGHDIHTELLCANARGSR